MFASFPNEGLSYREGGGRGAGQQGCSISLETSLRSESCAFFFFFAFVVALLLPVVFHAI